MLSCNPSALFALLCGCIIHLTAHNTLPPYSQALSLSFGSRFGCCVLLLIRDFLLWSYIGDLQNEEAVLEWLVDDDNRELADEIEQVNNRMLERLLDESHFLAVFFCKILIPNLSKMFGSKHKTLPQNFTYRSSSLLLPWECLLFSDDEEDCSECDEILEELEKIDGEADLFGEFLLTGGLKIISLSLLQYYLIIYTQVCNVQFLGEQAQQPFPE